MKPGAKNTKRALIATIPKDSVNVLTVLVVANVKLIKLQNPRRSNENQ
jgi:hypothetical protein